ncbi:MAG: hypothetical protein D6690_01660 [Nitrospirae bacterium]|nr:MAG: hypothetical protein D6690_01660 [Nitrospirota bacterium]
MRKRQLFGQLKLRGPRACLPIVGDQGTDDMLAGDRLDRFAGIRFVQDRYDVGFADSAVSWLAPDDILPEVLGHKLA